MKEAPERNQNALIKWTQSLSIKDLLLFGAILLFFIVAPMYYGAASINSNELREISGRFDNLEKNKIYKNIGQSYQVHLIESSQDYILKADFAACLDEKHFHQSIQKGDTISMLVEGRNPILIHSIQQKEKLFIDRDCIDAKTTHIGIYLPILIVVSVILLWFLRRKINQDRN